MTKNVYESSIACNSLTDSRNKSDKSYDPLSRKPWIIAMARPKYRLLSSWFKRALVSFLEELQET